MGKSRDLLLWQLGKKPSTKSDKEAYHDYLMRRARDGQLTEAAEEALKKLHEEAETNQSHTKKKSRTDNNEKRGTD